MILREIKTAFSSEVPILDLEISNDVSTPSGKWEYNKGDVISCAIFYGDLVTCVLREKSDDRDLFKDKLISILDKLPTFYAFNYLFEKECLKGFLGKSYFVEEIKPAKGKGWSKEKFFKLLVSEKLVKEIPEDQLENNSKLVLNRYLEGKYEDIIKHNISDVIKQYWIWKYKHFILKKVKVDSNGWVIDNA